MKKFWTIFACLLATGCAASARPHLYPNDHLVRVGHEQCQRDIDECCALADTYVKNSAVNGAAKDIAVSGSGSAVAAAGDNAADSIAAGTDTKTLMGQAGREAAASAVHAAMDEISINIFKAQKPCPAYKDCVERCLHGKGYKVAGWE